MDAAKTKAVEDAYRRGLEVAELVARAGIRIVGELSYASVDTLANERPPVPMGRPMAMMRAEAAAPAPTEQFTPQTISVSAHVNALFTLK